MKRKWILKDNAPEEFLSQVLEHPRSLANILYHRGLRTAEEVELFLNPTYGGPVYDPFILPDMKVGVARTLEAIKSGEKITVYADYDADAVTAATVMIRTLRELGAQVDYYIPDRFSEGYGMNVEAIREIAKRETKLIVTVDCGITAVEEVAAAKKLGVDVVVTDHHHVPEIMPDAVANINPQRSDSLYPFRDLVGAGVSFKFCQALLAEARSAGFDILEGWEKWLLDIVAIGTVADCQDLLAENRVLVKYGLMVMAKTRWPGLKALLSVSGVGDKAFTTGTIGFQLAPRINAAGRIAHAEIALKLLLTEDELEAADLALQLEKLNKQRQNLTEGILSEAREQVEEQLKSRKILFAVASGWPKGVVGLVAGKLSEEYYRPVLVGTQDDLHTTGSARSIPSFNIVEAMEYAGEHAVKYGGHAAAAGFTLENGKANDFYNAICEYAENAMKDNQEPFLHIDAELHNTEEICLDFADIIEKLAPFGQGNPRPHFLIRNLKVDSVRAVGKNDKHAQLLLSGNHVSGGRLKCIAFSMGFLSKALDVGDVIDAVGELSPDEWNGYKRLQFRIIDWRKTEGEIKKDN